MRIVLIEFPWQVIEIINNKETFKRDVIVSLNPESSYILKTNEISYFETYRICNHKELWSKYKDITNHTIKISKVLDEALWNKDKRFRDLNWKFFDDYYYSLKMSFDQLFYYAELISKLIEKFNPSEIMVADTNKILIDNNFRINSQISVIKFLLKTRGDNLNDIKISYTLSIPKKKLKDLLLDNFEKIRLFNIRNFVKINCNNIYYKINFLINFYMSKPKYLSIGCFEILRYKKLYTNESKLFLLYHHNNTNKKNIDDLTFFSNFIDHLRNGTDFYDLIKHKNISFELIFNEILLKLLQQRDFLLDEYYKAKKIVNRIKPECLIFQTSNPNYSANITFRKVCINLKIPFAIWMHGGYGLTYSLQSYDVTDFRFYKNHISYGPYLKDLITSDKCILKKLEFNENYNILPVGSLRFDYDNRKKNLNKISKPNNKKTILFLMGCLVNRNHFYFGRNREKFETSLWEFHYDILCLLKKYQNKYNIIFKDYPNIGHKNLWKKILRNINADKILYVSNEHSVNDLLRMSDLNIMPWASTTFFEALYFDADIFVIEEDIFEELMKGYTKDEIYYFNINKKFLSELEKYLQNGNFYTCDKTNSRNYFLKLDGLNKRDELLNNALSKIN